MCLQGLMIGVTTTHRISGVKSSGLPFVFWLVMSIYAAIKMRTLALVAEDNVCVSPLCAVLHIIIGECLFILCTFLLAFRNYNDYDHTPTSY